MFVGAGFTPAPQRRWGRDRGPWSMAVRAMRRGSSVAVEDTEGWGSTPPLRLFPWISWVEDSSFLGAKDRLAAGVDSEL